MNVLHGLLLAASLSVLSGTAAAQDAIGNGTPQPRLGKLERLTPEQCKARAAAAASAPGDAKDAKSARLDRYCAKVLKKAAK